ncbi:MAG: gliding motility lipoprotein GldH [Flavisolibacter sp.]
MKASKKMHSVPGLLVLASCLFFASCQTIDLYEKNVPVPGHAWQSSFKPQFQFNITDTTLPYQLFMVLRHNEKYNYNNIWVKLTIKPPADTAYSEKLEILLANNEKGWLGTGMDDLYEHRARVTPENGFLLKKGLYTFTIEHMMRDDPLLNVMNVGLRIEKKTR